VELGTALFQEPFTIGLCSFRLAMSPFNFEVYGERGRAYGRLKDRPKAIADYSMALALMPADNPSRGEVLWRRRNSYRAMGDPGKADADLQQIAERDLTLPEELRDAAALECNNLAWGYVAGAEDQRNPKKALPFARKAVKLNTEDWNAFNTLGVVYYRLGQYSQATDALQRSLDGSRGEAAAFDLFFLAMCHARTGAADKARTCFEQAVRWVRENPEKISAQPGWGEELRRFRAEAEEVLKRPSAPSR
jgi:tetratricopeptide (TPR) repeat protein